MSTQEETTECPCSCGSVVNTKDWIAHFKNCDASLKTIDGLADTVRAGIYLECKDSKYALEMLLEIIRKLCK